MNTFPPINAMPYSDFVGYGPIPHSDPKFFIPSTADSSMTMKQKSIAAMDMERLPLKDNSNTMMSASTIKSNQSLLFAKDRWTTGKSCHQTLACRASIRACMENGISEAEVVKYIVSEIVCKGVKAMELKRAKPCIYNIKKAMKKQARGEVVKKTSTDDEITALYIPFQQNGVVYKNGHDLKERNALTFQTAIIAPSNSMEEADRISNVDTSNTEMSPEEEANSLEKS